MNHNFDKTQSRGITPIIIALIVAVVLGGGYMASRAYFTGKQLTMEEVPTPPETKAKIIDELNKTADWKTYKAEKGEFEFKYPKEWKIRGTSKDAVDATFEYFVYPSLCDRSKCDDREPMIQITLRKRSFSEYIGNVNFSNKSAYTLGGKAGFVINGLGGGAMYIFEEDGKALTIMVGLTTDFTTNDAKEKDINKGVNQILSTFKFTK